ncbi:MAG: prolipoprotein diacylglyceryl transferase family protein [Candidatus Babeliales bacterium]
MLPHLLHIYGPLWIQSYGVMIAISFICFLTITYNLERRKHLISDELYLNTVYIGLVAGIIGGRLLTIINTPEAFSQHWYEVFFPWVGGLTVLGAILGVIIAVTGYLMYHSVPVLPLLDIAAVYTPLMQSIGRIGCFLSGCCYGIPASSGCWWAVTFSDPACQAPLNIPLHPAQLYTMVGSFTVFLGLFLFAKKLYPRTGALTFLYLVLENINRFVTDFWRSDREALHYYNIMESSISLSTMQTWSLVIGLVALIGLCIVLFTTKNHRLDHK